MAHVANGSLHQKAVSSEVGLAVIALSGLWWVAIPMPAPAPSGAPTSVTAPKPVPVPPTTDALRPADEPPALQLPVEGVAASALRDTFAEGRDNNGRIHEAIVILTPRSTPVPAVADGAIGKLFLSKPSGITIYQFDATGQLRAITRI